MTDKAVMEELREAGATKAPDLITSGSKSFEAMAASTSSRQRSGAIA